MGRLQKDRKLGSSEGFLFLLLFLWDWVMIHCPGCPSTCHLPASACECWNYRSVLPSLASKTFTLSFSSVAFHFPTYIQYNLSKNIQSESQGSNTQSSFITNLVLDISRVLIILEEAGPRQKLFKVVRPLDQKLLIR